MKENLRQSLDDALAFQRLVETFRKVIKQMLESNPNVSDELTILMIVSHNGLGNVLVKLFEVIEIINERIFIYGNGEGLDKKLAASFEEDGQHDLVDDQMEEPQDEYIDDDEDYQDEWELGDD